MFQFRWLLASGLLVGSVLCSAQSGMAAPGLSALKLMARATESAATNQAKPAVFDAAMQKIQPKVKEISDLKTAVDAAKTPEEKKKAEETLNALLDETELSIKDAMTKTNESTELVHKNYVRYILAYVYFLQKKNYEAAIMGDYLANRVPLDAEDQQSMAMDGLTFAMSAFMQSYQTADEKDKPFELQQLLKACDKMIERFPTSTRTHQARETQARIYHMQKDYLQAAKAYEGIPENAAQYEEAQLQAGQLYWNLYLDPTRLPPALKKDPEPLKADASTHLLNGIKKSLEAREQAVETKQPIPPAKDSLIQAKISLSQIHINNKKWDEAIAVLTQEPYAPSEIVEVKDEKSRPKTGIKRLQIATLIHRLLLRCYVGINDIEKSRGTMKKLEEMAGEGNTGYLTDIYVNLGKKLLDELQTLKDKGDDAGYKEVKDSFEVLLKDIAAREEGQTMSSLLWVANTYIAFGETDSDETKASEYFKQAADTYRNIIKKGEADSKFASAGRVLSIKMELIRTLKRAGDFDEALNMLGEILTAKPKAIDAQIEAAHVLQARAASEGSGGAKMYEEAIQGTKIGTAKAEAWGWYPIALNLQRLIDARRDREGSSTLWGWSEIALGKPPKLKAEDVSEKTKDYQEKMYEAWLHTAESRLAHGKLLSGDAKKKQLEETERMLRILKQITGDIDDSWARKLNTVFSELRAAQNAAPEKLFDVPDEVAEAAPEDTSDSTENKDEKKP